MEARTEQIGIDVRRLIKLRDIAIPFARKMNEQGKLNFSTWMTMAGEIKGCGTHGCLLGWTATLPEFKADGWEGPDWPVWGGHDHPYASAAEYFAISDTFATMLFGSSPRTLDDRASMVDGLIVARLGDQA